MHDLDPGAILKLYKMARSEMTVDKSNNSTSNLCRDQGADYPTTTTSNVPAPSVVGVSATLNPVDVLLVIAMKQFCDGVICTL